MRRANESEVIDNNDNEDVYCDADETLVFTSLQSSNQNYVPWQSPGMASRRILQKVKESPRVARRMLNTMTSPAISKKHHVQDKIFVVNMKNIVQECAVGVSTWQNNKIDSW